ncbi:envelope membrane protein [Calothrix sp. PCC 6303]|uniref:envelope membrane protein n=1 Tax=Calothrix sp. PCC 6303 TaxID=1170562 RepID=UPI0002A01712|nr:envelope membrane protein [Calothrix sp. PCC 6303]AFY99184.1 envelope membrane protein [Calothrix sp. PCC 6303]
MSIFKSSAKNQKPQPFSEKIANLWSSSYLRFLKTPERALTDAYEAAKNIEKIEIAHFNNQKISANIEKYSPNIMSYWITCRNRSLLTIRIRLAEFNASRYLSKVGDAEVLGKLKFIDEITSKYNIDDENNNISNPLKSEYKNQKKSGNNSSESTFSKTGVIPKSLGRTINRVREDFSQDAEVKFVNKYRVSQNRTRIAIKFLLVVVIVPLLTQQLSKQLLLNFVIKESRGGDYIRVFLNQEMEETALKELSIFEKDLQFKNLLKVSPKLSSVEIETKVKEKAGEIYQNFLLQSNSAISNVFADVMSLVAFAVVIATNRRAIQFVKDFMDEIVYTLSDSAKAFLIILFTDIFVGFHSPHGWEVLLDSFAKHLGLPANQSVIFFFIATFPVILNTIFKYWIFRYLSRLSPSALATLKEMDE